MGRTACTEPQCLYKGALYLTFSFFTECESASGNRPDSAESILRPQMPFLSDYPPIYNHIFLILFLSRLTVKFSTRKQNKRSSMWNVNKRKIVKIHGAGIILNLQIYLDFLNIPKQKIRLNNTWSQFAALRKQAASRWQRSMLLRKIIFCQYYQ